LDLHGLSSHGELLRFEIDSHGADQRWRKSVLSPPHHKTAFAHTTVTKHEDFDSIWGAKIVIDVRIGSIIIALVVYATAVTLGEGSSGVLRSTISF